MQLSNDEPPSKFAFEFNLRLYSLVAVSDPITEGELWFLDGSERLAFVNDAIRSTRAYDMTIIFESRVGPASTSRVAPVRHHLRESQVAVECG